jgi:hypothetical protein
MKIKNYMSSTIVKSVMKMLLQSCKTSGLNCGYISKQVLYLILWNSYIFLFQIPKLVSTFLWQIHLSIINNHIYVNAHESKIALNLVDTICVVEFLHLSSKMKNVYF